MPQLGDGDSVSHTQSCEFRVTHPRTGSPSLTPCADTVMEGCSHGRGAETRCWASWSNTPCEVRGELGEMQSLELCRAHPGSPVATGIVGSLAGDNRTPTDIILWKIPAHPEPSPAHPRTSPSLLPQGGTPGLEKFIPEVLHGFAPSALPGKAFPQGRMLCPRSAQGASDPSQTT